MQLIRTLWLQWHLQLDDTEPRFLDPQPLQQTTQAEHITEDSSTLLFDTETECSHACSMPTQQTLPSVQLSLPMLTASEVDAIKQPMEHELSSIFAETEPPVVSASAVQLLQAQAKEAEHREAQRRSKQDKVAALQQHLKTQHRAAGLP